MTRHRWRRFLARLGPTLVILGSALFFIAPILSTLRQAMQAIVMPLLTWNNVFKKWNLDGIRLAFDEKAFWPTLRLSLKLAVVTVLCTLALLVPTALFVHLKMPKARAIVEFLTVLPYVIPPIALVAGVTATFRPHARWFINSDYSLVPFYMVLALPFTYRSIDAGIKAIDVRTLVDASRSLGAGWLTTMRRVLLPNLSSALISSSFLTATVVLGEYTISSSLAKQTFPVFSFEFYGRSARGGVSLALLTLLATTALLGLLTLLTRRRWRTRAVTF